MKNNTDSDIIPSVMYCQFFGSSLMKNHAFITIFYISWDSGTESIETRYLQLLITIPSWQTILIIVFLLTY